MPSSSAPSKRARRASFFISASFTDRDIQHHLAEFLGVVFPGVEISSSIDDESVSAGQDFTEWLTKRLEVSSHIFVILTPESIHRPLMMWEQGAIYSSARQARVFPLAVNLDISQVPYPLQQYRIVRADSVDDVRGLVDYLLEDERGSRLDPEALHHVIQRFVESVRVARVERDAPPAKNVPPAQDVPPVLGTVTESVTSLDDQDAQMLCELLFKLVVRLRERPEMLQSVEPTAFWAAVRKVKPSAATLDDLRAIHADLSSVPAPGSLWASWMRTVRATELAAIVRHADVAPAQSAS